MYGMIMLMVKRTQTARRKKNTTKPFHERVFESDSTYFLKLVVICILATLWLKFATPITPGGLIVNAIPVGALIGVLVVRAFEHHQQDRKIWYAMLLVIGIISYFVPAGIVI